MNADDPRMANVHCGLTRYSYELGLNGLQIAEQTISTGIDVLLTVLAGRAEDPTSFPIYGEASAEDTARRILGRLLDAGWRPPDTESLDLPRDGP